MKIDKYIIVGGNDLNAPPQETEGFPSIAKVEFFKWLRSICWSETDEINYIEVPVSHDDRLFIRPYWDHTRYSRTVCYYVGFILSRDLYREAGEYYVVNRVVSAITLDQVLSGNPDPLVLKKCRCPKTAIWKPFSQLSGTEVIGADEVAFKTRCDELCFSISVNNLDDWFERLAIAINPSYRYPSINYFVSKKNLSDSKAKHDGGNAESFNSAIDLPKRYLKRDNSLNTEVPRSGDQRRRCVGLRRLVCFVSLVFIIVTICAVVSYSNQGKYFILRARTAAVKWLGKSELSRCEQRIEAVEHKLDLANEELAKVRRELETANGKISKRDQEIERVRIEKENMVQSLKKVNKEELERAKEALEAANAKILKRERAIEQLKIEMEKIVRERDKANAKNLEYEREIKRLGVLKQGVERIRKNKKIGE